LNRILCLRQTIRSAHTFSCKLRVSKINTQS
jgi:hypothetical protein